MSPIKIKYQLFKDNNKVRSEYSMMVNEYNELAQDISLEHKIRKDIMWYKQYAFNIDTVKVFINNELTAEITL